MKCTKCKKDKPYADFRKNKNFPQNDGYSYQCKGCDTVKKRTPEGRLVIMYNSTRSASRGRGVNTPTYSIAELSKWAHANGYMKVYNAWKKAGYSKELVPSIDRIDPRKPYAFSNIQIVSWAVNNERNVTQMSAKITRYDINGKNPKQFKSVRSAARSLSAKNTGSGILKSLKNGRTAHGYKWTLTESIR